MMMFSSWLLISSSFMLMLSGLGGTHFGWFYSSDLVSCLMIWLSLFLVNLMMTFVMSSGSLGVLFMVLAGLMMGFFSTLSLMLFFLLFELSLFPTMLLIMKWGYQPERLQASLQMMLYTMCSSVPLLISLILLISTSKVNLFLGENDMSQDILMWPGVWVMLMMAFLVKIPMYFFHLWLPKAHVEAPTYGSMLLAGLLLKLGGFGLFRFSLLLGGLVSYNLIMTVLVVYGGGVISALCMSQTDMKCLVAYSSVSHMSVMVVGYLSASYYSFMGGSLMMLAHGLCSSYLFYLCGEIYSVVSSRSIVLMKSMFSFSTISMMVVFLTLLMSIAVPPSMNLLSELLVMTKMLQMTPVVFVWILLMVFFGGLYVFYLFMSLSHSSVSSEINFLKGVLKPSTMMMGVAHVTPLICLFLFLE